MLDRRATLLGLTAVAMASPGLAAPAYQVVRLKLTPTAHRVGLRRNLPFFVTVTAVEPCALVLTGEFDQDGFRVLATAPDGAQHTAQIVRRPSEARPHIRRIGGAALYSTHEAVAGNKLFVRPGVWWLSVQYTPPSTRGLEALTKTSASLKSQLPSYRDVLVDPDGGGVLSEPVALTVVGA